MFAVIRSWNNQVTVYRCTLQAAQVPFFTISLLIPRTGVLPTSIAIRLSYLYTEIRAEIYKHIETTLSTTGHTKLKHPRMENQIHVSKDPCDRFSWKKPYPLFLKDPMIKHKGFI